MNGWVYGTVLRGIASRSVVMFIRPVGGGPTFYGIRLTSAVILIYRGEPERWEVVA